MVDIVKVAKALSDPIRYKILLSLLQEHSDLSLCCGGVCNCDIMERFGLIQSRVSYHMKELVESDLVVEEQRGKWKYYSVNLETLKDYIKMLGEEFRL